MPYTGHGGAGHAFGGVAAQVTCGAVDESTFEPARRGIHFGQGVMAIQAAIDGQGVALGDASLAAADLRAGRLVRPFDLALKATPRFAYWIVTPPRTADRPLVQAFREWLLAESAAMQNPAPAKRRKGSRAPR